VSRSLNEHEKRHEVWKGEALAAVYGVKMMRSYLWGVHFYLHTDHRALLWIMTQKELTAQSQRWVMSLQDHTFSLVHKPGAQNPADALSRYQQPTVVDPSGARMDKTSTRGCQLCCVLISRLTPQCIREICCLSSKQHQQGQQRGTQSLRHCYSMLRQHQRRQRRCRHSCSASAWKTQLTPLTYMLQRLPRCLQGTTAHLRMHTICLQRPTSQRPHDARSVSVQPRSDGSTLRHPPSPPRLNLRPCLACSQVGLTPMAYAPLGSCEPSLSRQLSSQLQLRE
jgi:hypothetical protein